MRAVLRETIDRSRLGTFPGGSVLARRGGAPAALVGLVSILLLASAAVGAATGAADPVTAARHSPTVKPNAALERQFAAEAPPLDLPAATSAPDPAPPSLSAAPPLQSHEIFGFAPWWNLGEEAAFDVKDLTTLAYFSVDINPDGTANQSDSGWVGYQSQALTDLINRAHAANDRVVLTATCFDQQSLDRLTSDPQAPARLGSTLVQLVSAKNLDGVNFDFEGNGPRDRQGLDNLVAEVAGQLRAANPHWQVSMSTYASSAGDQNGFFDIAGLDKSVDAFFVMAYDMDDPSTPSPTAPLTGPGNNDNVDLAEYTSVVPPSKVILGVPYYGYDWPTAGPYRGDTVTGTPTPVTFAQVSADRSPSYWDRTSDTPWTAYQVGSQWHQVWFDDPTSVALKARLADAFHVAGLGVWALGMDGNDPAMIAALLGNAAPAKYLSGPAQPTPVAVAGAPPPAPPQYHYSALWNGATETLQPYGGALPGGGQSSYVGTLQGFSTNDPAATCLSGGKALPVYELAADPGTYVVQVTTPAYCANGTWTFNAAPSSSSAATSGSGGSGGSGGTSTTTSTSTSTSTTTTTTQPTSSTTTPPTPTTTTPSPVTLPVNGTSL